MKRIFFLLMCICLAAASQAAIIAFEAEAPHFYYVAGANWTTVEDAAVLGGEYITATANSTTFAEANVRYYSFHVIAGTYDLYAKVRVGPNTYNDDSIFVSNSTFNTTPPLDNDTYVNMLQDATTPEGGNVRQVFGWVRLDTDYVMAADGTGYLMVAPREDGLDVDAFAYVTQGETVSSANLDQAVLDSHYIPGAATDPVPADKDTTVNSETTTAVTWTAPSEPNIVSVTGYDVVFGTDPNMLENTKYTDVANPFVLADNGINLDYGTTYYWRVDSHDVWDSDEVTGVVNDTVEGYEWTFTTIPNIIVDAGDDILTALELLPAALTGTIDYSGDDITDVTWKFLDVTGVPAVSKQMINRTSAAALENLAQITTDPSLLQDWIGTDIRDNETDKELGNPMVLHLKGLPAGTYSWTSYHHDPDATFTGMFDATVMDASGSAVTTDIQIGDSNSLPIGTFTTSITADGTDDVILIFDQHPYIDLGYNDAWFVMNGFELTGVTGVTGSLNIDFGQVGGPLMTGYQAYEATHENAASFTEQSYSAFGSAVSILPTWGGYAAVADTTNDFSSATQAAALTTNWPATYIIQLSTTNSIDQTGSDTLVVTVAADACAAAQLSTSWTAFNESDFNEDCVVSLDDFALMAAEWLDDRNMAAQE